MFRIDYFEILSDENDTLKILSTWRTYIDITLFHFLFRTKV